jgi:hypothetical protein
VAGELEVWTLEWRIESTGEMSYFSFTGPFDVVAFTLNDPFTTVEEVRLIEDSMWLRQGCIFRSDALRDTDSEMTCLLLVVKVKVVALTAGLLRRPTLAMIGALEVWSSRDVDALKEPVMGAFVVTNLAWWAWSDFTDVIK